MHQRRVVNMRRHQLGGMALSSANPVSQGRPQRGSTSAPNPPAPGQGLFHPAPLVVRDFISHDNGGNPTQVPCWDRAAQQTFNPSHTCNPSCTWPSASHHSPIVCSSCTPASAEMDAECEQADQLDAKCKVHTSRAAKASQREIWPILATRSTQKEQKTVGTFHEQESEACP